MNDRLAVIPASGDPRVLETGLMYARNAVKGERMMEARRYLFGPSETRSATDPSLQKMVHTIVEEGRTPVACRFCSDSTR